MKRVTINNVNKALQDAGINAIIVRGKDYYYFVGDDISCECEVGRCFKRMRQKRRVQFLPVQDSPPRKEEIDRNRLSDRNNQLACFSLKPYNHHSFKVK